MTIPYVAPLATMRFVLREVAGLPDVAQLPGCEEASPEVVDAVLAEAAKLCSDVLAPLNRSGDVQGCRLEDGRVRVPDGWTDAYRQLADNGWIGLALPAEYGGQGLPRLVAAPVAEMIHAANLAFSLCPQLATGQVAALLHAASDAVKRAYVPKLVAGTWSATMNLTEPQAGSDLGAVAMRAVPAADGTYRLSGQKIFITYGEHEMTPNIVHLVLARLPDAPPGVKGISMFVVPKFVVGADGAPGARNDVRCIALEEKLGIHGSPTCTMSLGEAGGAVGELVGERNRGLEYMFVMMNDARFGVGLQGIAIGERAYQQAAAYAAERVQGRDADTGEPVTIDRHPDVRRMLLTMQANVLATRLVACVAAGWFDIAEHSRDPAAAQRARRYVDLLMPVVKGWSTELGSEVCDLAVQVHGGAGFVEQTGVAQHLRDARITTIYEGTTGIQANDLVLRKLLRDGGRSMRELVAEIARDAAALAGDADVAELAAALADDAAALARCTDALLARGRERQAGVLAVAVPFLRLVGTVCGSWQMARAAHAAARCLRDGGDDPETATTIAATARFWYAHRAPYAAAHARVVLHGGPSVTDAPAA